MLPARTSTRAEIASRTRLAVLRLSRRLRQQGGGTDVSPSMLSALSTVERLEPVTLGDLAEAERVQPPTMTRIVARLQEAGLVVREADATDRRVNRLRLSPEGRRLVAQNRSRKDAYLVGLLNKLPPKDVRKLDEAMAVIEKLLEDRS